MGLLSFEKMYPYQLSGGMKQRVAVARALSLRPKVLLMDEPFMALDSIMRKKMQLLTREVCRKYGVTVVFVTHSVDEALLMAERILVFDSERKIEVVTNDGGDTLRGKLEAMIGGASGENGCG
jgi:NitT/TauT family transport system ATP-binding protein